MSRTSRLAYIQKGVGVLIAELYFVHSLIHMPLLGFYQRHGAVIVLVWGKLGGKKLLTTYV
jgi:hypothetical protein